MTKNYTSNGLIVLTTDIFPTPLEIMENEGRVFQELEKLTTCIDDLAKKDEELAKYLQKNEESMSQEDNPIIATMFVTGGLFTYSLLDLAARPDPLPRITPRVINQYMSETFSLMKDDLDGANNYLFDLITRENPVLMRSINMNKGCIESLVNKKAAGAYVVGATTIYHLLDIAATATRL